jgi:Sigma-70, region 4
MSRDLNDVNALLKSPYATAAVQAYRQHKEQTDPTWLDGKRDGRWSSGATGEALVWWIRQTTLRGVNDVARTFGRDGKTYPRRPNDELPQRIWELRDDGMTIREIATELGCSVGTVHRHLHNA